MSSTWSGVEQSTTPVTVKSESLRRSKRNKFHLDVLAILSSHPDRRRAHTTTATTAPVHPVESRSDGGPRRASQDGVSKRPTHRSPEPPTAPIHLAHRTPRSPSLSTSASSRSSPLGCSPLPAVLVPVKPQVPVDATATPATSTTGLKKRGKDTERLSSGKKKNVGETGDRKQEKANGGMAEVVGKRERKVPVRHRDFVCDDELQPNAVAARPSGGADTPAQMPSEEYHCVKCPARFDSRTGLANHIKQHGAMKKFACLVCDFSCENSKTMRLHGIVHDHLQSTPVTSSSPVTQICSFTASPTKAELTPKMRAIDIALNLNNVEPEAPSEEAPATRSLDSPVRQVEKPSRSRSTTKGAPLNCSECTFSTQNAARMDVHRSGHAKLHGFQCPICTFKSESAGFLKRHCQSHGRKFPWPPVYVSAKRANAKKDAPAPATLPNGVVKSEVKVTELRNTITVPSTTAPTNIKSTYSCGRCKFSAKSLAAVSLHKYLQHFAKRTHCMSGEKKIMCARCKRKLRLAGNLLVHSIVYHISRISRRTYCKLLKEHLDAFRKPPRFAGSSSNGPEVLDARIHRCSHCPFTCGQTSRLLRHENKHFVKADHECPHCTFSCRSEEILAQHMRLHQPARTSQMPGRPKDINRENAALSLGAMNLKMEKCLECPYRTRHVCDMKAHAAMHIGVRAFPCTHCSYSTKRAHVLHAHLKMHAEEDEILALNGRNKSRARKATLLLRFRGQLVGERRQSDQTRIYVCRSCPFRTPFCSALFSHSRNHFGSRPLQCSKCSFSTFIERKLREHSLLHPSAASTSAARHSSKSHHTAEVGNFSCKECPFFCNSYGKLWHHAQKHKKAARFTCDQCSFSVGSAACLAEHRFIHSSSSSSSDIKMEKIIVLDDEEEEEEEEDTKKSVRSSTDPGSKDATVSSVSPSSSSDCLHIVTAGDDQPLVFNYSHTVNTLPPPITSADTAFRGSGKTFRCSECPFADDDHTLFSLHRSMHWGRRRPFACNMCSFSAFSPEALYHHLSLHAPPLSPHSAAQNRKRVSRRGHSAHSPEVIPHNGKVFQCPTCNYRTGREERFTQHRIEHAQHIQQRLITTIKRAALNDDPWPKKKWRRVEKKTDKQFLCSKCSFRCDTAMAYNTHVEKHGSSCAFTCSLCDYSASTASVTEFHEANHHLDTPLTYFYKDAAIRPEHSKIKLDEKVERRPYASQEIRCRRCDFNCYRFADFAQHWQSTHGSAACNANSDDVRAGEELRLRIVPANCFLFR